MRIHERSNSSIHTLLGGGEGEEEEEEEERRRERRRRAGGREQERRRRGTPYVIMFSEYPLCETSGSHGNDYKTRHTLGTCLGDYFRRLEGTCCLHLQGRRARPVWREVELEAEPQVPSALRRKDYCPFNRCFQRHLVYRYADRATAACRRS
jgi:hypothetical protein